MNVIQYKPRFKPWLLLSMGLLVSGTCVAGTDSVNFGSRTPSMEEVVDVLKPRPAIKMRGIQFQSVALAAAPARPSALSMEVRFAYNSARLSPEAKQQLTPVGEAMAARDLSGSSFLVEGHTDSVGSDGYNQALSKKRAWSVKLFFVDQFKVDPAHLVAVGQGERMLLDPQHPKSSVNRRVRIATQP